MLPNETNRMGYASGAEDAQALPNVYYPWRRYFARGTDLSVYSLLAQAIFVFVFQANVFNQNIFLDLLEVFCVIVLALAVEPLLLARFGTTFGKWIFGIQVKTKQGENLSYRHARARTCSVLWHGLGFNIPIYTWVCLVKSYKACNNQERFVWDEDVAYTIKDTHFKRTIAFLAVQGVQVFCIVLLSLSLLYPPNRGALTIAEFSENYNYYRKTVADASGAYAMASDGTLQRPVTPEDGVYTIALAGSASLPEYQFICNEAGEIQEIIYTATTTDAFALPPSYQRDQLLVGASVLYANHAITLSCRSVWNSYIEAIVQYDGNGFSFASCGANIAWSVKTEGYDVGGLDGMPPRPIEDKNSYTLTGHIVIESLND